MSLSLEYDATLRQNERIANTLRERGVPRVDLIENPLGEPVAVHLPDIFDPSTYLAGVPDSLVDQEIPGHRLGWKIEGQELRNAFPMVFNNFMVPSVLGLLDVVVQASAEEDVLATNVTQWDYVRRNPDSGLHIDSSSFYPEEYDQRPLSGTNGHLSPEGEREVEMGIVRDSGYLGLKGVPLDQRGDFYREHAAPFAEFKLRIGDGVIFQGGAHLRRHLLPIAHNFVTTTANSSRRYDLFTPAAGAHGIVIGSREQLIRKHGLEKFGYTAQPSPLVPRAA